MKPEAALQQAHFQPGFRLSWRNVAMLPLGGCGAWALWRTGWAVATAAVVGVVGHFFLFRHALRMARVLELIWAAVFVAVMALVVLALPWVAALGWSVPGGLVACATAVLVCLQVRRADYHGVGWRYFTPDLPAWFAAQHVS